jgi:hypothetical protein
VLSGKLNYLERLAVLSALLSPVTDYRDARMASILMRFHAVHRSGGGDKAQMVVVLLVERLQGSRFFLLSIGTADLGRDSIPVRRHFFNGTF